jgi:hypothetical protein
MSQMNKEEGGGEVVQVVNRLTTGSTTVATIQLA